MVKESQLILSDRSLMPGDVVRRLVKNKDTQRGYCRSVEVFATVQIVGTKQVKSRSLYVDKNQGISIRIKSF